MTISTAIKPSAMSKASALRIASRYGTFAAFLLLIAANIAITPNFLSWQTLNVNLTQVAAIVIVATGMTLVIAIGGIDLSGGSLMAISGAIAPMIFLGTLFPVDDMALAVGLAYALIRFTVIGRQIIAVGGNEKAARLTGIPVKRVKTLVYVISGAFAGIVGLIVVARNPASDANLVGIGMELDAIAASAVGGSRLTGGRANIFRTLLGAFVIQLVRYTLLANGVPMQPR